MKLSAGDRGETVLSATAPATADNVRRLMTAEMRIDGKTQRPISEAPLTRCDLVDQTRLVALLRYGNCKWRE